MFRYLPLALLGLFALPTLAQDATPATARLIKQAEAAYRAKHFSKSASLYTRALPSLQDRDRAGVEYNLARAQALAGDRVSAIGTFDRAVEDGYTDRKKAEADRDLVSLRADARWQPLLERMTTFATQQEARWGEAAFVTPYAANIADADKLAGLAELWAQAKFGFANFWHVPRLNWDQTYREFIPKVLATHSTAEYYRALQNFYALLADGHTNVYPPDQLNISPMPLRTRLVDGRILVLGRSRPGFDLQDLHAGDEILTIEGEPAIAWAQQHVQPFIFASTQQDRDNRTFGSDLFRAPEGTSFHITASGRSGERLSRTFTVPPWVASVHPLFELRLLPDDVVYIALNGFEDETAAQEWYKHWPEISKAKSLIVDLRENGGGSDSVGDQILATLIDKTAAGELSRSTRWIATYRAWGIPQIPLRPPVAIVKPDPARHFSGPVVLLTSPRTFSAGEDMLVVFVQAHRGKTIGEPTGGSTGQPLMFKLPGGGSARICTKHDSFADGREFVGIGIQPDIPVHVTRTDIIAGRDAVLETAVQWLEARF